MLIRFAFRQLRRRIGFSLTVVVTLALGVGANLAIFQLLQAVLLTPLPVVHPSELYALHTVESPFDAQWFYSYPAYERLSHQAPVIAHSGTGSGVLQSGDGSSQAASLQMVSPNFFAVRGLSPAAGRLFQASDDTAGHSALPVILDYDFARNRFASPAAAIGMKATLNRTPIVVVGVAPKGFTGVVQGVAPDVWLPLIAQSTGRFGAWFDSLGPGYDVNLQAPYRNQDEVFWLWVMARIPTADKASVAARWTQALVPDLQLIANATKLRHTAAILAGGIVPGIGLTLLIGRSTRTLLYGVRETDPGALILASGVLIVGGLLATLIPARRASALDPMQSLRTE